MRQTRKTGQFVAVADDGRTFTIEEFTNFIDAGSMENPIAEIEGLKGLRTSDGMHVNVLGDGEYKIVETGLKLRKA